jgi:hypothetical protein
MDERSAIAAIVRLSLQAWSDRSPLKTRPSNLIKRSPPHPAGTAQAPGSLKDFAQIVLKRLLRDASLFYFTLTRD